MYLKKRRHKPLYKKFVNLRKNVQNRTKLLKFKKRKWQSLISYIKRTLKRKKNFFRLYDQNRYHLSKYSNSFVKRYKYKSEKKKEISLFYGNISKKYIKKQVGFFLKKQNFLNSNSNSLNSCFIELFERRLDVILYRAHFSLSISNARQLISHKRIFVNNQIINYSSYKVKNGDLITVKLEAHLLLNNYISRSNLWPLSPKYLQINYKTLQIIYLDPLKFYEMVSLFPFWFDVSTIIKLYR